MQNNQQPLRLESLLSLIHWHSCPRPNDNVKLFNTDHTPGNQGNSVLKFVKYSLCRLVHVILDGPRHVESVKDGPDSVDFLD